MKLCNCIYCKSSTYCTVYALNITRVSLFQWMLPFFPLERSLLHYVFKSTCEGCKSSTEIECLIFMSVKWSVLPSGCSVFLLYIPALFILLFFATSLIPSSLISGLLPLWTPIHSHTALGCRLRHPFSRYPTFISSLLPCFCVIYNVAWNQLN